MQSAKPVGRSDYGPGATRRATQDSISRCRSRTRDRFCRRVKVALSLLDVGKEMHRDRPSSGRSTTFRLMQSDGPSHDRVESTPSPSATFGCPRSPHRSCASSSSPSHPRPLHHPAAPPSSFGGSGYQTTFPSSPSSLALETGSGLSCNRLGAASVVLGWSSQNLWSPFTGNSIPTQHIRQLCTTTVSHAISPYSGTSTRSNRNN